MSIPHPIPYQGSKRNLASAILSYFPPDVEKLIEPFAGSAAVTLAAAYHRKVKRFHINDLNKALMDLWEEIINQPEHITKKYEKIWLSQLEQERDYYNSIREKFNQTQKAEYLLFLLVRCVKASVRYNSEGGFNQSPDNRRRGTHPITMRSNIRGASLLLKGKTAITAASYEKIINMARHADLIYMDPPYQGVCNKRDPRYINGLSFDSFVDSLDRLNEKGLSFIVSYDGKTGSRTFGEKLPDFLNLNHIEIDAGRSSQATLLGRDETTYESLYLSPALVLRLEKLPSVPRLENAEYQSSLF
jgi:DNA adenine methylase